MLAPPSASTIAVRRNSTQHATPGNASGINTTAISHSKSKNNTIANPLSILSTEPNEMSASATASARATTSFASTSTSTLSSTTGQMPPPIPRRTFLGKIIQNSLTETSSQSPTLTIKTTINNVCKQTFDEVKRRNTAYKPPTITQQSQNVQRRLVENHYPIDQYSDDDRLSIESSIFEEPKSSDPIILLSNRSSSDSNKSQTTIDTGYMSASIDNDRIFFGASEDFRSRFSSVDTQSSMDSFTSSELQTHQTFALQNQARCIISPLAVKRDEYEDRFCNQTIHGKSFNRLNSSNSLLNVSTKTANANGNNAIKNQSAIAGNRMPLNANRNQSRAVPLQPQILQSHNPHPSAAKSQTGQLPPAPMRPLDSGRILYNGSMLGAFQSGLAKITSAAATTSEVVMGRRSFKKASQIAHTKLTQRQDSSISNDSFSLNSSPSYNTKNGSDPSPPINASKNSRTSCLNNNPDVAASNSTSKYYFPNGTALRQDSTISNDSFSQTSSPSYNVRHLEQPLLAHAADAHASKHIVLRINRRVLFYFHYYYANSVSLHYFTAAKQHINCTSEITKEDANTNAEISKSASTPASLQAVIRFQNGSNMSLQHKVSFSHGKCNVTAAVNTFHFHIQLSFDLGHKSQEKLQPIHNAWNIEIPFTSNPNQCTCFADYCW